MERSTARPVLWRSSSPGVLPHKELVVRREQLDSMIRFKDRNEAGLLADTAQIYGMEPFAWTT